MFGKIKIYTKGDITKMRAFRVKNIKSFKDSGKIELSPITVFVGKNSCGKSSLLRFPVVLAQTMSSNTESPLRFYGRMLDYGNYEDVVFGRREENIEFEIHYDIDINNAQDSRYRIDFEEENEKKNIKDVWMHVVLNKKNKKVVVEKVELYIEDKCMSGFYALEDEYKVDVNFRYIDEVLIEDRYTIYIKELDFEAFFPIFDSREAFSAIAGLVLNEDKTPVDLEKGQEVYNKLFNKANPYDRDDLSEEELQIKRIHEELEYASTIMSHVYNNFMVESRVTTYIGPFRENPERVYRDSEAQSIDVGVRGENVSTLLIRDFQNKKDLIDGITTWLYKTMGYKLNIKDMGSNLFQIMLVNDAGIESNILDVGFGISQVLPIVTQIVKSILIGKRRVMGNWVGDVLYVEQPELHLHPAAQADLAELFVNCVNDDSNRKVVIETHSEHLIRKLQVLIADRNNGFTNDMIKIYYVDKNERGVASVEEMKILENGKFEQNWPTGFFDKAYQLSMELLKNAGGK